MKLFKNHSDSNTITLINTFFNLSNDKMKINNKSEF